MSDCECLEGCPFFNDKMDSQKGIGHIYKMKYCLGDSLKCARYMVFKELGKPAVPANLFPNMVIRPQRSCKPRDIGRQSAEYRM